MTFAAFCQHAVINRLEEIWFTSALGPYRIHFPIVSSTIYRAASSSYIETLSEQEIWQVEVNHGEVDNVLL